MMKIKKFLEMLYKNFNKSFFKENLVFGKYNGDFGYSESTLLMNVIFYNTLKEYNKLTGEKLKLSPEHGGKCPSDFCILNNKKEVELYIEHENDPDRIRHNLSKLIKKRAKYRLLICYERRKLLNKTIKKLTEYLKSVKTKNHLYIWIAPWDIEKMSEFRKINNIN